MANTGIIRRTGADIRFCDDTDMDEADRVNNPSLKGEAFGNEAQVYQSKC